MENGSLIKKILQIIDESDIRTLVYIPPLIGLFGFIIWFLLARYFTNGSINNVCFDVAIGIALLLQCIPGIAEVRKKEMPGTYGRIIKGRIAIISGIFLTIFFGFGGLLALGHSLFLIFQK
jgi:hypothetical protein